MVTNADIERLKKVEYNISQMPEEIMRYRNEPVFFNLVSVFVRQLSELSHYTAEDVRQALSLAIELVELKEAKKAAGIAF